MKPVIDSFKQPKTDRRKFLLGLLFGSAAGVAAARQPSRRIDYLGRQRLEDLVPKTIGPWNFVAASGLVVPPDDQLSQATYSQLLTRVYWDNRGEPIMLLLAQSGSQTGFLQIHRPETCYTASGYSISEVTQHPVPLGARTLIANNMEASAADGQTEHVVYWTRVGDQIPRSWREQRIAVAMDNIRGIIPDAILGRVSIVSTDREVALATLDAFIRDLIASVPKSMQRVFTA